MRIHTLQILETPRIPDSDTLRAEITTELHSAKAALEIKENRTGDRAPPQMPLHEVANPRHRGMTITQLEAEITRLQQDLATIEAGWHAGNTEGETNE